MNTAQAGDHTLVVKAKHLFGTDTQTWNIICESTGLAIPATTYADASTITLFLDSGTGKGYLKVDDGARLEPGTKAKFGIRVESGTFPVDKVLVGDGGGYRITAVYNNDLNLYLCYYFVSDTDRIIPVLIEAVHPNGQASKAKFVFRTVDFATSSQLIRKGLGVLVGKDIVQSAKGMKLNGLSVNNLIPFAGANDTYIMKLTSGIFSIPFNFNQNSKSSML